MSSRVPPAPPRRSDVERAAYRKLITGQITAEQYRDTIAPRPRRKRRWRHAR